jgi:hypothetical protein
MSFEDDDEELRMTIRRSFAIAEEKNMAVAFHLDDSMFWINRKDLWQNSDNVEWSDWKGAMRSHRIIGWAAGGAPILATPMCYTSQMIKKEATRIAKDVVGAEIKKGINILKSKSKEHLFAGVISGWETRLDDDAHPRVQTGYCALHNLGYSASNPPKDFDLALDTVVHDWILLWAKNLNSAGIPKEKIYSHIPVTDLQIHTPLSTAFNEFSLPGFSVYPGTDSQRDTFVAIYDELEKHDSPHWANTEGTNVNMRDFASSGGAELSALSWEKYLSKQFEHGATLVNIFAWQEPENGPSPFGRATHSKEAIREYKTFLNSRGFSEK